jgi:hypothetical protein
MSILIDTEKGTVVVMFIEYRPGEGLVLRVVDRPYPPSEEVLSELRDGLNTTLRSSPYVLYRTCCDSTPGCAHGEDCSLAVAEDEK